MLHLTFLLLLLGVPYIENINICLNTQRFIGAIAKDIAMALTGSLEGRRTSPTANFAILIQYSLSDTRTSLTSTLYSLISRYMHPGAPSTLPRRPLRVHLKLFPCTCTNQQIQVPAMMGVLWSVHCFTSRCNGPNHSAVVCSIFFTTFGAIWAAGYTAG
jgi:hypothetical protein